MEIDLKDEIINTYLSNPYYTNLELASIFNVTRQYIGRLLKPYKCLDTAKQVEDMYYNKKNSITEISNSLQISVPTIRKILKTDEKKFKGEKATRKQLTAERTRLTKKQYAENKRLRLKEDQLILKELLNLQAQNAIEMSTSRKISNRYLVTQNIKYFKYDKDKNNLIFNEDWVTPCDFPQKISIKIIKDNINLKLYHKGVDGKCIED